jgi:hypothetical protein
MPNAKYRLAPKPFKKEIVKRKKVSRCGADW